MLAGGRAMATETSSYTQVVRDGLWDNNIIFTQMLALCPLMALTSTATNGLGMGLATLLVLVLTNTIISMVRNWISPEVRIPVFVLLIAAVVTVVDMVFNAWLHELHKVLGLFLPLIVTNCAILGRAESFASRNSVPRSLMDGFSMGVGFTFALTLLGILREITASGTVFAQASSLLGNHFSFLETTLIPHYRGFLLMMLPPGGFLALGFVLAGKRLLTKRDRSPVEALQEESIGCH
jgi:electron transport complex protein RnfE